MHPKTICNAQERNNINVIEPPPDSELSMKHLWGSLGRTYRLCMRYVTLADLLFASPSIENLNRNAFTATWGRGK